MNPLDLYARIEPMIGFYEAYDELYTHYLNALKPLHVKHVLDVGCGNGKLLKRLDAEGYTTLGVDLSPAMIARAQELGVNAQCTPMQSLSEQYECVIAAADVLNYMDEGEMKAFLQGVSERLVDGGYFCFDVNTLFGFEAVAEGTMIADEGAAFLGVEATFLDEELVTDITLFEQVGETYQRHDGRIRQYYHELERLKSLLPFTCKAQIPIRLFNDEAADKMLFVCQKV